MPRRRDSGATLALVVACIFVILAIGGLVFFLLMTFGGGRELQNLVDSGDLNVTNQALVTPSVTASAQFAWLGDSTGAITLNTINRVMAQALLVSANGAAMVAEGTSGPNTASDVSSVVAAANSLAASLGSSLSNQDSLAPAFQSMVGANNLRMIIGGNQQSVTEQSYQVAYVDRGNPSNVAVLDTQIPPQLAASVWTNLKGSCATSVSGESGVYMKGYVDGINFDGNSSDNIHFVPLKSVSNTPPTTSSVFETGQTHLISNSTFASNLTPQLSPAFSWASAVPNAIQITGSSAVNKAQGNLQLTSSAVARSLLPSKGYLAAMPNGYIRIVNVSCSPSPSSYGFPIPIAAAAQDIFTFLNSTPVIEGLGASNGYFVKASDSAAVTSLNNVIAANAAGKAPSASDLAALAGPGEAPPSATDGALITSQSVTIDNTNADALGVTDQICSAFGIGSQTGSGNLGSGCMAAVELANVDLLSQRYDASLDPSDSSATVNVSSYYSGVAVLPSSRGPIAANTWTFTTPPTLGQIFSQGSTAAYVMARIAQRLAQINPSFSGNVSDLATSVDGWNPPVAPATTTPLGASSSDIQIPIGTSAYIYFLPTNSSSISSTTGNLNGQLVVRAGSSSSVPSWLTSLENSSSPPVIDGKPGAYDSLVADIPLAIGDPSGAGGPAGIIDVNGDWGFSHPYDGWPANPNACNVNTFVAYPSSGMNGLLLEVDMGACFTGVNSGGSCPNEAHADMFTTGASNFTVPQNSRGCTQPNSNPTVPTPTSPSSPYTPGTPGTPPVFQSPC